ncbi:MAG: ubiquinol-cytochrome c reductase iron-sulfur subunit [Anaerolineales bacterium]|nr:ubiquinol-cytochrome c reductase iron-sulfur subunit [Anaerolineales bacterium]MCB9143901.1 ubiquinol-cytochrome c reductase iron-sulfur subunit [Anaerolineales bacterium]
MTQISRRDFLKLAREGFLYLSAALATGSLLRFLSYAPASEQKTEFDLGSVDNYPVGSRTSIPEIPALLIHAESGFTALSLTCTHLGCTLEPNNNGFACPCHNSAFDAEGNVTQGPAVKPLRSLRIQITDENTIIAYTD